MHDPEHAPTPAHAHAHAHGHAYADARTHGHAYADAHIHGGAYAHVCAPERAHNRHPLPGTDRKGPGRRSHGSQSPPTRPHDGRRPHPIPTHDKGR